MKRKLATLLLLAALVGWGGAATRAGKYMSQAWTPQASEPGVARFAQEAPGYVGPWGQPIAVTAPDSVREPGGAEYAKMLLAQKYPPNLLMQAGYNPPMMGAPPMPGGPGMTPFGAPPVMPGRMPGPGGMPGPALPAGAVAAVGALTGPGAVPSGAGRTEIRFVRPAGMKIAWYAPAGNGKVTVTPQYLEAPARYNFLQAAIYRLKLSDIPNRAGVELYPTLEVYPCTAKTATFLAHSAVPVSFTDEDFEQVAAGNFVVKVIYLPDPQFQDLAATGPDEVVSSRLEPGVDPILEAKRRGSILAIVRLGDIDLEAPNTPAMDAPPPGMMRPPVMAPRPGAGPMPPGPMVPGMPPMPPPPGPMGKAPTRSGINPVQFFKGGTK